jgi:hypothetical protein
MRAPPADPFVLATVPPLRLASDFCLFTSWLLPNEADAGRFSADIVAILREYKTECLVVLTVESRLCSESTWGVHLKLL